MTHTIRVTDHVVNTMMLVNGEPRMKRIAEYTSSCSDNPYKFVCPVHSAKDAMAALYLLSMVVPERAGISRIAFTDHIAQMAYNYRYEAEWQVVQEILELPTLMPYFVGQVLFKHMNTNDYYGNFQPLVLNLAKRAKMVSLHKKQNARVKHPQRKRGYDDKGTLRPSHRWLPTDIHLGANPEPVDYRCKSYAPRNRHFWLNNPKGEPPYE